MNIAINYETIFNRFIGGVSDKSENSIVASIVGGDSEFADPSRFVMYTSKDFGGSNFESSDSMRTRDVIDYRPDINTVKFYRKIVNKNTNTGFASLIYGLGITTDIATEQIKSAVLGALESFFGQKQRLKNQLFYLQESDIHNIKSLIAVRLGNLPEPISHTVANEILKDIRKTEATKKISVNGGSLAVAGDELIALPTKKYSARELIDMHLDRQGSARIFDFPRT